ncbi:MAG: FecR domain-containing protein [Bacteroidetes bacterium]|nr:FecR domain-containing protein [Bacteroidota bacterium]
MEEKKNIENFNRELLANYLNNEVSSGERLEVESWLNESEKNREELMECQQMLKKVDVYYKAKSFNSNAAWSNVHSKINPAQLTVVQRKKGRKETIAQFYKYAAIIVVAILLGSVGYYIGFRNQTPAFYSEIISVEKQVLKEYVLPDGSVVTLNSNSKLEFPKQFAGNVREVTIIGEAFFDVKPNPKKPFIINAGNTQVKVLGTSFNVCAYPETETVEVVVKTGKVQVIQKTDDLLAENNEVFLTPGEKGTLFNESNLLEKSVNTDLNFLAWKTNDIIFNETPLGEVIRCLEKVYHIEIQLNETELNDLILTAHFDKKPIDFVLNVVRLTFNLELNGENEHFTLASRTNNK